MVDISGQEEKIPEYRLITNSFNHNFYYELKDSLLTCKSFDLSIAFITYSGLQLILDVLKELEQKGIKGRILTSNYLNFTDPKALRKLKEFTNIETKIYLTDKKGFHTKGYIFEYRDYYRLIVGSSNLTQSALKHNIEWNLTVNSKEMVFNKNLFKEYNNTWDESYSLDEDLLLTYEKAKIKYDEAHKRINNLNLFKDIEKIKPNYMQDKALKSLKSFRKNGENKALVIASTGSGKTYMAAFDVEEFKGKFFLFLVHREEILYSAKETFINLGLVKEEDTSIFTGNKKEYTDYMFSTVQTMSKCCEDFEKDDFDYIIIDEAHHVTSKSYQTIVQHFKPKFLLGMTATPERGDGGDIFDVFDDNIALDLRLRDALAHDLVAPFHYFGIDDITVDYGSVSLDKISEMSKLLKINKRVEFIIEKLNFYGWDGEKLKGLGFCIDINHALYMAEEFNKRGIFSIALTGKDKPGKRRDSIKRLQDESDPLKMIFTVDIFNEGIDIPDVNVVLMLRPTNSPIIFVQQLGRGLRRTKEKEYLTVLDFIGNHNRAFLISLALSGSKYYDKDSLKVSLVRDFIEIPGCTHIQMDKISKERILNQLENENFNALKYLKEEYREFKMLIGNKIPLFLDYLRYDGAPNPIKFFQNSIKNYLEFLLKVDESFKLDMDPMFSSYYSQLTKMLPIKRPFEFIIIKNLVKNKQMSIDDIFTSIGKVLDDWDEDTVLHTIETLNLEYADRSEKKSNYKFFEYDNINQIINIDKIFLKSYLKYEEYYLDLLNYGLLSYQEKYGRKNYGVPFFKLYSQYSMRDAALLSNYKKIHSSFRGSGLIANGKEYFLFIDLHKENDIKESINYDDKFLDTEYFQWQTPNSTSQASERGKNIIYNKSRGINLHLFVRKYKKIDNVTQNYIYLGRGNSVEFKGEKPITVKIKLENEIPNDLFMEFIYKV